MWLDSKRTAADVFDIMSHLIDKSLVFVTEQEGPDVRYRLLETVRQYAHEKLLADEDASRVSARHTRYYLRLAEECEPRINTRDRQTCLALLEREHSNMRMATERASRAGETRRRITTGDRSVLVLVPSRALA